MGTRSTSVSPVACMTRTGESEARGNVSEARGHEGQVGEHFVNVGHADAPLALAVAPALVVLLYKKSPFFAADFFNC